jgi:hypothetical protein
MQTQEYENNNNVDDGVWMAFCFDCGYSVAELRDFWMILALAEVHGSNHHHMVGITTWLDRRLKKEVQLHVTRTPGSNVSQITKVPV